MSNIEFYNVDAMDFLKGKEDKIYELAIVDPPYGMPKSSSQGSGKLKNRILNRGNIQEWDTAPSEEYFNELFRVSKNQIIWGGNYFDLPPNRCFVIWDKEQPFENFSAAEYAWTSFDKPSKIFRQSTVRTNEDKIHPTQKPVKLYKYLLDKFGSGVANAKILDTHGGSMSIAIACDEMGYDLDICEINTTYFDAGVKRFNQYKKQLKLF